MNDSLFRIFLRYVVIFFQKILPTLPDIGERIFKTDYSIYKTGRVIYEMSKHGNSISGEKKNLVKSHLNGNEIFLHLKATVGEKILPHHIYGESHFSSGNELYFYMAPHISRAYSGLQLDAKDTISSAALYSSNGDLFVCREFIGNSHTWCTHKKHFVYEKWSWIIYDSHKRIENGESFTYFPKIKILLEFSDDLVISLLPNTLLAEPGTTYKINEVKETALKSNLILIPGKILKKIHNADFYVNNIYKCFLQIWIKDGEDHEVNVYCVNQFTPNDKKIIPKPQKINFRKSVKVRYLGIK